METKEFTIKTRAWVYNHFVVLGIVNCIVLFTQEFHIAIHLIEFDVIYLGILLTYPTTVIASIGNNKLIINKLYFLKDDKEEQFNLHNVDFSYRKATISRHTSKRRNVLTVYYNEEVVFDLEPGENGWNDTSILNVIAFLKQLALKQTIEKYSGNDIEV